MSSNPIDFYFDFSSPYSYIAAERIESALLGSGRTIRYCPILFGVIVNNLGNPILVDVPLKGEYSKRDFVRSAHFYGLELNFPAKFPIATQAAARATLMLREQQHPKLNIFIKEVFRAYFVRNENITDTHVLAQIANSVGIDGEQVQQADANPLYKDMLKATVSAAMEQRLFGVPYFVVDGEAFWGNDRLEHIQRWVTQGPF